ncbi:MAG: hypothetical protein EBU75_08335 [Betaproteobacteria bacterium]|nr:hypothetical protein [Betaproteobacteria bacterium]
MMSPDDLDRLIPAERLRFRSPIPLQPVSSEEFTPGPQTPTQRRLQSRLQQLGEELARHQGLSRRAFFQSAAGMAAAFVAMNEAISGSGSEDPRDWFLTNGMKAQARADVNARSGARRLFSHAIFMPGLPGWLDKVDEDLAVHKPDSFKGYTVGDNTNKHLARHPWHLDDEKLLYPFYEKLVKASKDQPSLRNVCVHKGLFPPSVTQRFPQLLAYADVRDVGRAARDWPQLNFIIYHSGFRYTGAQDAGWAQFEQTGRIDWVTDLAEIPQKFGVRNVYGDLGQIFAQSTIAQPLLCAAMMGQLVQGLGADHVVWGTDAVWTGAPQWQIEALRRLEIPEAMRQRYGFSPLGPADGAVKNAIFGENSARLYGYGAAERAALTSDRVAQAKRDYDLTGGAT